MIYSIKLLKMFSCGGACRVDILDIIMGVSENVPKITAARKLLNKISYFTRNGVEIPPKLIDMLNAVIDLQAKPTLLLPFPPFLCLPAAPVREKNASFRGENNSTVVAWFEAEGRGRG